MMNIQLLGDRIALRLDKPADKTKGGIALPDTAQERVTRGRVVAVGPGNWSEQHWKRQPLDIEVGDRIVIGPYSGSEMKVDDEELTIVRASDVLAVTERGAK